MATYIDFLSPNGRKMKINPETVTEIEERFPNPREERPGQDVTRLYLVDGRKVTVQGGEEEVHQKLEN